MAAVIVRRVDDRRVGQGKQLLSNAVILRARIAPGEVGASGGVNEQRVAGEHAVSGAEAHAIWRVPGSVKRPQFQLSDANIVAVIEMDIDVRSRGALMH